MGGSLGRMEVVVGQNTLLSSWASPWSAPLFGANENSLLIVVISGATGEALTILSGSAIVSKIMELATDSRRKGLFKGFVELYIYIYEYIF